MEMVADEAGQSAVAVNTPHATTVPGVQGRESNGLSRRPCTNQGDGFEILSGRNDLIFGE